MKTKSVIIWAVLLILLIASSALPQERRRRKPEPVKPQPAALSVEDSIKLLEEENEKLEQQVRLKRLREYNQQLKEELGQMEADSAERAEPQYIISLPSLNLTPGELDTSGKDLDYQASIAMLHGGLTENGYGGSGLIASIGKRNGLPFQEYTLGYSYSDNLGRNSGSGGIRFGKFPFTFIGDTILTPGSVPNFTQAETGTFVNIFYRVRKTLVNDAAWGLSLSLFNPNGVSGEIGLRPVTGWQITLQIEWGSWTWPFGDTWSNEPNFVSLDSSYSEDYEFEWSFERIMKRQLVVIGYRFPIGVSLTVNAEQLNRVETTEWFATDWDDEFDVGWTQSTVQTDYSLSLLVNHPWLRTINLTELQLDGRWSKRSTADWEDRKTVDEFWSLRLAVTGEFIKQW